MKRQFLGVQEGVWAWQQLRRRRVSRLPRGSGSTEPRGVPLGAGPDSPEGQAPPCPGVCPWGQVLRLPRGPGSTVVQGCPWAGPDSPEGQAPPSPGVCPWGQVLTPQRARLDQALGYAPGDRSSDSPEGQAPPSPGVCPWGQVLRLPRGPGSTEPWGVPLGASPQTPQRVRLHLGVPLGRSPDSLTLQTALPPLLLLLRTTVARTPRSLPEHLLCAEP